jgi:hypothetical protein
MSGIIGNVKTFMTAVDNTTDSFNVAQTGLYMGLVVEESSEVLGELIHKDSMLLEMMENSANGFKSGAGNGLIDQADRVKLAHELCDLLWVTTGALLSMGVDIDGAMGELTRANMSKLHICDLCKGESLIFGGEGIGFENCPTCNGTGYICKKDENGKVIKPDTFVKADMTRFVKLD